MKEIIPAELIERKIYLIRGQRVMLDRDLAKLYGVETKMFKRAVRRNWERFPSDFMFQLNRQEFKNLRCHFGTSRWGGTRYLPFAFTEQGVAMLSGILNSKRAVRTNIAIMRAFVRLRQVLATHKEFANRLEVLERRIAKNEMDIKTVAKVIRGLLQDKEEEKPKTKIGFSPPC